MKESYHIRQKGDPYGILAYEFEFAGVHLSQQSNPGSKMLDLQIHARKQEGGISTYGDCPFARGSQK